MTSPTRISQIQTLHRELACKETPAGATLCRTTFALKIIVFEDGLVGLIIEYRERRIYLPPIVSDAIVPLPKKYAKYFDSTIFPELVFVDWGRI